MVVEQQDLENLQKPEYIRVIQREEIFDLTWNKFQSSSSLKFLRGHRGYHNPKVIQFRNNLPRFKFNLASTNSEDLQQREPQIFKPTLSTSQSLSFLYKGEWSISKGTPEGMGIMVQRFG